MSEWNLVNAKAERAKVELLDGPWANLLVGQLDSQWRLYAMPVNEGIQRTAVPRFFCNLGRAGKGG
jgi:hypothetical protein